MSQLTYGQKLVGLKFNPSNLTSVDTCKQMYADRINVMNELRTTSSSQEQKRLCSIAITELQGAQMWEVKAITWIDGQDTNNLENNHLIDKVARF